MKEIYTIILLATLLLSSGNHLLAQEKHVKFSGRVIDKLQKEQYTGISINYSPNDGFRDGWLHTFAKLDNNGHFEFTLPDLKRPYKVFMAIANNDASNKLWSGAFYSQPGDNINMEIVLDAHSEDSVSCTGFGSEKYNLAAKLEKQINKGYYKELPFDGDNYSVKDTVELNWKMEKLFQLIIKYETMKYDLIKLSKISPEIKAIMNYEFAQYSMEWVFRSSLLFKANANFSKWIFNKYSSLNNSFYDHPNDLSLFCPIYLYGLSDKIMFD